MPHTNLYWRTIRPAEGFYNSEVHAPRRLPVRTFLPTGYEPNYPYPLLVLLHGDGGNEEEILRLAPRLSRRNYVCISLRGPQPLGTRTDGRLGYGWGNDIRTHSFVEDYVIRAIELTRRNYHIHSERIYLAGYAEGATLGYRLGLTFPERFGGLISLNGIMPRQERPLFRLPQLRELRVFIGHGIANVFMPLSSALEDRGLLYTAGLNVRLRTYPTTHRLHSDMLRDIDHWIMERVNAE